jgi:hypothetical protein
MVQQIRDARVKITIDAEEAKRDIDLLRKSIGQETKVVSGIKSTLRTEGKKTEKMMGRGERILRKTGKFMQRMGARGMRTPDIYTSTIMAAGAAAAMSVNWFPLGGPTVGTMFRTVTQQALPFTEYGGTFMKGLVQGLAEQRDPGIWGKIQKGEGDLWDAFQAEILPSWMGGKPGVVEQWTGEDAMTQVTMTMLMAHIDAISTGMTQMRIWQANMEMALKNVGSAVKTDLALGMDLDVNFLKNVAKSEWRVADATNHYRMAFEKIVRGKIGENLGSTIGKWIRKGTDPRGN